MPARLYSQRKIKRHLYLTDVAFEHISTLAQARGSSPSEVVEQLVRHHIRAIAIPSVSELPPYSNDGFHSRPSD